MAGVMIQFRHTGPQPSPHDIAARFGIKPDEIDADFGVIATDAAEGLYTILVDEDVRERVMRHLSAQSENDPAVGDFSNPRIEPFGPEN